MTSQKTYTYLLPWLFLIIAGLASAWLRYGWVQPPELAHSCDDVSGSLSCGFRHFIVIGFNSNGFGITALVVAALSLLIRKLSLAWLAAALGVFAAIMFCYTAGSIALLVGMLRLLRAQETTFRQSVAAS